MRPPADAHRPPVDERPGWRPARYETALWGCELRFTYPIVKPRDYRTRRAELEASDNPFATVVLAHLAVQDTRRCAVRRFIQARFGVVPPAVEQRIAAADRATLDQLHTAA